MSPSAPAVPVTGCVQDSPSVLIVDPSAESREVLRFALERRGVRILEAEEAERGLDLLRRRRPHVVVLDLETDDEEDDTFGAFDRATGMNAGRLVVLGRLGSRSASQDSTRVFSKPYHFAPLIHKIEELLAAP